MPSQSSEAPGYTVALASSQSSSIEKPSPSDAGATQPARNPSTQPATGNAASDRERSQRPFEANATNDYYLTCFEDFCEHSLNVYKIMILCEHVFSCLSHVQSGVIILSVERYALFRNTALPRIQAETTATGGQQQPGPWPVGSPTTGGRQRP